MNRNVNVPKIYLISFCMFFLNSYAATVILPSTPVGSSVYILPGIYGAAGDNFFLNSIFNAPNGSGSSGSAVTISGNSTFTLAQSGIINQQIGGGTGIGSFRSIVLAKAGATINNLGTINGISNSATENTFGMVANSIQSGLPSQSSYANNYGLITMQGASTDGMHAAGILGFRSYITNYGVINATDRVTGVSSWVEGMSATGNGMGVNETIGIINANSKAGSRGSAGMFGGFNQTGFDGTNAFSANDPQMINKGLINSTGDSHGLYYWGDFKTFQRNDSTVNITGRGHGVYFDNSGSAGSGSGFENAVSGVITTSSNNSYGVYLRLNNNIYANNNGVIQTAGNRAHGIVAYSTGSYATNAHEGIIRTNGDSTAGIFYSSNALNNPNFTWNLGNIEVNGANSFGIATPQNFFRNDGTIIVNGMNSYGMLAGGSYNITPDGTIVDNTYLGGLTQLSASQGAAQTVINHGVISAAAASTTGMAAQGVSSIAVNGANGVINANGTGVALLAKSGGLAHNFGNITVGADSVGMQVDAGSAGYNFGVINFVAQNGFLIGNTTNTGTLYYDAGNGNANYSIQGNLVNSGTVYLGGIPGNTLTITGDYIGQQGFVGLNAILNGDNSPANLLVMDGGAATGVSGISITNTTGLGALTLGNGILVVNSINGGTTDANAFYLATPAVAGPYEYFLIRGANDGSNNENWYLFNTFDNPAPNPPIPLNPDIPTGNNIPLYRREVSLAAAIPSMALLYDQFILSTLHQRVGEQEQINDNKSSYAYTNGVWLKGLRQKGTFNNNGIYYSGPGFNYFFNALQMGIDIYHDIHEKGSSSFAGILGSYGKNNGDVDHLNIVNAGTNNFDAWTVGGYFTHYDPKGWYFDSVIFTSFHQIDANSKRGLPSILANGFGTVESIEGGYNIALRHGFGFEPEAQFVLEQLSLNNSRNLTPIVSFNSTYSSIGRVGARLTRDWALSNVISGNVTGWLFGNVWHQFQGNSQTNFSTLTGSIPFNSELAGTWHQVGIGLNAKISKIISIYGTGSYASYWKNHGHSSSAELGIRINA